MSSAWQVDVSGTGLEHLVNGAMGKALSVYATNDADKVLVTLDLGSTWGLSQNRPSPFHLMVWQIRAVLLYPVSSVTSPSHGWFHTRFFLS